MPELPEVESARRAIDRHCVNKRIAKCHCFDDNIVFVGVEPAKFAKAMRGRTLAEAKRKGKHMWWVMDKGPSPLFHLGMTGAFVVPGDDRCHYKRCIPSASNKAASRVFTVIGCYRFKITAEELAAWPKRYIKCHFTFDDGTELFFVNKRRLGRVRLVDKPLDVPPLSKLGFDPLTDVGSAEEFHEIISKRTAPIKALLLNQSVIAGVGNWIADEVLYQSGLHPETRAVELKVGQTAALYSSIIKVVNFAVENDAQYFKFPRNWLFHFRWSKAEDTKAKKRHSKKRKQAPAAEGGASSKKKKRKSDADSDEGEDTDAKAASSSSQHEHEHVTDFYGERIQFLTVGGRTTAVVRTFQKGAGAPVRAFVDEAPRGRDERDMEEFHKRASEAVGPKLKSEDVDDSKAKKSSQSKSARRPRTTPKSAQSTSSKSARRSGKTSKPAERRGRAKKNHAVDPPASSRKQAPSRSDLAQADSVLPTRRSARIRKQPSR